MNCSEAHTQLLEADLADLRGETTSELSRHLHSCGRCRAAAERILQEEANLADMLVAVQPRVSAEAASKRAQSEARLRRRRRIWYGLAPALAAAGFAGILLVTNGVPTPGALAGSVSVAQQELPPIVETASGQQVAVFETDNPNIVVVWSF